MIVFECPRCKKRIEGPDDAAGEKATCPSCGKDIHVPPPIPVAVPPPLPVHAEAKRPRFTASPEIGVPVVIGLCIILGIVFASLHKSEPEPSQSPGTSSWSRGDAHSTTEPVVDDDSLEYKLATINAGGWVAEDDLTVARFRSLLSQLSDKYVEDQQQIADITVTMEEKLRDEGIDETLLNIMKGMNQLFSQRIENQQYAEYATTYFIMRRDGMSHQETVASHQDILRVMGVH